MESAVFVSGFYLLLFSTGVQLSPDPELMFGREGGDVTFYPRMYSSVDDCVLYRICEDGDLLLLINCSQPERPQPDGHEVRCGKSNYSSDFYFEMFNLTMSHSGDYRAEIVRGGNITEDKSFRLTVCAEGHKTPFHMANYNDSLELCSLDSPLGHGSSLQLYRRIWGLQNNILVLDTNSSLEPLVEDLKGRLHVDLNTSLITLSGVVQRGSQFYCTIWKGAQCQSYSHKSLMMETFVFAYEDENVTLPCIIKGELPDLVIWHTFTWHEELIINHTHPHEGMYMLNGSQTGDYSLIIPSVSLKHSGLYACKGSNLHNSTLLYVCTKLSPLDVMFSPGQNIHLNITEHTLNITEHMICIKSMYGIQWYRQKILQPQVLIADIHSDFTKAPVSLPEDLRGRVTVSTSPSNSSLVISNPTAEGSGVYTWRVYEYKSDELGNSIYPCSEGSFRLVYLDPLGVHSHFYRVYASLMGCGLLGLVAAVIWFILRSRRGEQTSGRQSREGQQSGDEDLYDDVEMAELNTPPSAVSDGAVEHSI